MSLFDGTTSPTMTVYVLDTTVVPAVWAPLPHFKRIAMRRGRSNPWYSMDAGTLTVVVDNTSGDFDPDNTGSTWYPLFSAATKAKLVANWDSTDYTLFVGWLEGTTVDHGLEPVAEMTFVDAIARISAIPVTALPDSLYDTEYDDEPVDDVTGGTGRVHRLWTSGTISTFLGSIDHPDDSLRKMTPIRRGSNLTQILDDCALVEAGKWYVTRENNLGFYRRDNVFDRPMRLTLSDSRAAGTIEYDRLTVSPGASLLTNDCRFSVPARNGNDEEYAYSYDASVDAYGIKSVQLSAPVYSADWAATLSMYFSRLYATPSSYVSRVEFDAWQLGTIYPDLLACELGDYITTERTTVDGRELSWLSIIEGLDYEIAADTFRVGFDCSPAKVYYPADATSGTPTNVTDLTPAPVEITSASGYTSSVTVDRIRVTDSKDIQLEGQEELGAATGTLNLNFRKYQTYICQTNATGNFTVNLRGSSTMSAAKSLRKGDQATVNLFVKNGTTAYRCTTVKVDGTTMVQGTNLTWSGGTAPASGTASGWDEYQFTVVKMNDGTLRVRASQVGAK